MAAKGSSGNRAAVIIAWFGVFLFGGVSWAQPGIEAYDRGDLQAVREYLSAAPGETAETLFLRAALMTDADGAVEIYRQVVLTYPESPISPRAMDRIRQYFYAQGKYEKAAEFEKTLKGYTPPPSRLEASSVPPKTPTPESVAKIDTSSGMQKPAPQTATAAAPASVPISAKPKAAGYCLQVGAFSQAANAGKLKATLQKAGYRVEIIAPGPGSNRFHTVRVIGFANEKDALAAAEDLRQKHKLSPILVPMVKSP